MKLASLKDFAHRDGRLIVVSRDGSRYAEAGHIAFSLQTALENWRFCAPKVQELWQQVENGAGQPLDTHKLAAPLPRTHEWLDGSAYVGHVMLVRKARGAELPESFWHDPLMYQGGGGTLLAAHDPIAWGGDDWGLDFEAEVAVMVDDVPMGITPEQAGAHIRLVTILNDVSARGLIPAELAKGFGFINGKPPTAFAPFALTPDMLGTAWQGGKVHLPLVSKINGTQFGNPDAAAEMTFNFPQLIAHAAKTRPLSAGSIIGSGTVCALTKDDVENGLWPQAGSSCIAERRMLEKLANKPQTPWLKPGDRVDISMHSAGGENLFGTISQQVVDARSKSAAAA